MTTLTTRISQGALLVAFTAAAAAPAAAETRINSACKASNADAAMLSAIPAEVPPFAKIAGLAGKSVVQFDLDARGNARNAAIVSSSGSPVLDDAARQAALVQTYSPEIRNCVSVNGTYRIVVTFQGNE